MEGCKGIMKADNLESFKRRAGAIWQNLKGLKSGWILFLIMLLAAGMGIYIIATTVLISQDGVKYINDAKTFATDFNKAWNWYWPGYSFLIFTLHNFISLFSKTDSIYSWIYCGQVVSLLARILSLIPLYFIGKALVGERKSLWGLFILVLLPYPAEFGSDVIRDWTHILFLASGMAVLIYGARNGKWWMFALAGLAGGLGHTVRPECAQVVIYGMLWLMICVIKPRIQTSRVKAVILMLALIAGFAIPAAPFMKTRSDGGEIIPNKLKRVINQVSSNSFTFQENTKSTDKYNIKFSAQVVPENIAQSAGRLVQAISENLIHIFTLPFVIGLFYGFRRIRKAVFDERFFILCLLIFYSVMMIFLHINYEYISRRHCLPMVIFGVFYVPVGLELIAGWIEVNIFRNKSAGAKDVQRVFFILLFIGLAICVGKLNRIIPLRAEKSSYVQAANWLKNNTKKDERIAVFDSRIGLYSEKNYQIIREKENFTGNMDYTVKLFDKEIVVPDEWTAFIKFTEGKNKVIVYKRKNTIR